MSYTLTSLYLKGQKGLFIANTEKEIAMNNLFIEHLKKLIPFVEKFDGKVLNKRFVNAYKDEVLTIPFSYCSLNGTSFKIGFNGEERQIYMNNQFKGYLSISETLTYLKVDGDYRLKKDETIESINEDILRYQNDNVTLEHCIENFDNYAEMSEELEKQIIEYQKVVPYCLRLNIRVTHDNF